MKKGFTLIELLAVIVILAIIALIAVPIVLNIINDTKNSSDEQSVELYKDTVEKTITKKQLSNSNFNPDKCEIQSNGNLKCYKNNELIPGDIEIDMKGSIPTDGIVEIKNNKIKFKNVIFNGKKYYENYVELVSDADGNKIISVGDEYTYQVNNTDTFNFYVLSIEDDNVNLIMDRNICENGQSTTVSNSCLVAWYDDGDSNFNNDTNEFGPVTAMKELYNATKDWVNVLDMDLSGDNKYLDEGHQEDVWYGYGTIETTPLGIKITKKNKTTEVTGDENKTPVILYDGEKNLKARLPKLEEVYNTGTDVNHCHGNYGSCPIWLVENLKYYKTSEMEDKYSINNREEVNQNIEGYWLLSSYSGYSNSARHMDNYGHSSISTSTSTSSRFGIRPVITVPKSYLE